MIGKFQNGVIEAATTKNETDAALIGEALMRAEDKSRKLAELRGQETG